MNDQLGRFWDPEPGIHISFTFPKTPSMHAQRNPQIDIVRFDGKSGEKHRISLFPILNSNA